MGRWAQGRRRGGRPSSGTGHPPPPAPVLAIVNDYLEADPQGLADVGGKFELEKDPDGEGTFSFYTDLAWADPGSFGPINQLPYGFYRVREIGNGIVYSGPSGWSGVMEVG